MPTQPQPVSRSTRIACLVVALLSVGALVYPPLPLLTLLADSEQYRESGAALLSGEVLRANSDHRNTQHIAVALRPPLFPLFLGITSRLPFLAPDTALITAHIVLGALLLMTAPLLLRRSVPPLLTTLATGFALYAVKQVAWGVMSEWLAMWLLLLAAVLYLSWVSRASPRLALAVSVCVSLAILTRTALLPWLGLLLVMVPQAPRGARRVTATALGAGLLPLLLWGAINLYRTGTFSIFPYEGLNLVATARSLGTIPTGPNDSEIQRRVISEINERGVTAPDSAFTPSTVHQWNGEFYEAFHNNFNVTTDTVHALENPSLARPSTLAARGLRAHEERYHLFLWGGARTLTIDYLPLILVCAMATAWLARKAPEARRWGLGVLTLCVLSLTYLAVIFGTMLWLHRYVIPVQPIILFCLMVSTGRLLIPIAQRR